MEPDKVIAKGKTKTIYSTVSPKEVLIVSNDNITAGDGARCDTLPGKGGWSTTTTCCVFNLLQAHGIPVAYNHARDDVSFYALNCTMIPLEVVVRREAYGSYLKRHPNLKKRHRFDALIVEFYLKTNDCVWEGLSLPCDDPLIEFNFAIGSAYLFDPRQAEGKFFASIFLNKILGEIGGENKYASMHHHARQVFHILEDRWDKLGYTLVDFKLEFGLTADGKLVLADVLDSDSWRLLKNGQNMDKQVYITDESILKYW